MAGWVALSFLASPALAASDCFERGHALMEALAFMRAADAFAAAAERAECAPVRAILLINRASATASSTERGGDACGVLILYDEALAAEPPADLVDAVRQEREATRAQCVLQATPLPVNRALPPGPVRSVEGMPEGPDPGESSNGDPASDGPSPAATAFAKKPDVAEVIEGGAAAPAEPFVERRVPAPAGRGGWAIGTGGALLLGSAASYWLALEADGARLAAEEQIATGLDRDVASAYSDRDIALREARAWGITSYVLLGLGSALTTWGISRWASNETVYASMVDGTSASGEQ